MASYASQLVDIFVYSPYLFEAFFFQFSQFLFWQEYSKWPRMSPCGYLLIFPQFVWVTSIFLYLFLQFSLIIFLAGI